MRRIVMIGLFALAVIGGVAWRHTPATPDGQGTLPKFRITLHTTASGLEAECSVGCAWTKQTYNCGKDATSCEAQIDQSGIGPVR